MQYGCMVAIHPNAAPFWVKCGKHPGVPVSSYEAEYIAAFKLVQRTEYFRQLLRELAPFLGSPKLRPVLVRDDNESVIKLTAAPDIPKRSRHIDVKYHYVRHLAGEGSPHQATLSTDGLDDCGHLHKAPRPQTIRLLTRQTPWLHNDWSRYHRGLTVTSPM